MRKEVPSSLLTGEGEVEDAFVNENNSQEPLPVETISHQIKPNQPILENYSPYLDDQKRTRDFQPEWFKKYPWIEYNVDLKAATCFSCRIFLQQDWEFKKWKQTEKIRKHASSDNHRLSSQKWMDSRVAESQQKSILTQLKTHHGEEVEKNRLYVKMLFESIAFLSKQNIALRSHRENRTDLTNYSDVNRGNYLELLSHRSNDSEFLKSKLKTNTWLSPSCQNEMIQILGGQCLERIVSEIKSQIQSEGSPFAVICDESSDISRHEQFSLCISYIDKTGAKQETFLMFVKVDSTTGENLFNVLSEALKRSGLDPKHCYGFALDGASNMSSAVKGLAARMKEVSPRSVYIHCHAHLLNLAVKDTMSSIKILKDTLGTVQSLYNFIEASPKRHAIFMSVEMDDSSGFVRVLKSLSVTRWTCHHEAVKAISEEMERIILCLDLILNDDSSDSKISSQAKGLLSNILDFEFIFGIEVLRIILIHTSKLSSFLQSKKIDYRTARVQAELVTKTLEMMRDTANFDILWEKCQVLLKKTEKFVEEKKIDFEVKQAKISRRSKFGGDIKSFFRVTNFYEPVDKILSELRTRFNGKGHEVLSNLAEVVFESQVNDKVFETVSQFYDLDLEILKADHKLFQHFKEKIDNFNLTAAELFQQLSDQSLIQLLPEFSKALKIFSILPVSSCEAERSFSSLRRLKTYLRNTMGQDRLTNLTLLHIERATVNKVLKEDMTEMINKFGKSKGRNSQLF